MQPPFQMDADLPPAIEEVASIVGLEAALRLADDFGGRSLYIPRYPGPHHPLTASIGPELAGRLAEYRHETLLRLPVSTVTTLGKRRRILELQGKGFSRFAIARAVGLTERRVYQILADVRGDEDQPGLFS